ncbi:hypothetical protein B9Z52_17325 [Limnohabitans sp. Jir72]|nr:hypothetical protein B9Z52_17325 [Limnohabitans sp. Jir72]
MLRNQSLQYTDCIVDSSFVRFFILCLQGRFLGGGFKHELQSSNHLDWMIDSRHRMKRWRLKGSEGDALHTILRSGCNRRWLPRMIVM